MNVPFVDLAAVQASYKVEMLAAAKRVMDRGWYILGPELEVFERDFAAFCGTHHSVGVANGTDALVLALRALGVGPGDEVLLPSLTFIATAIAVQEVGATPVFVDVRDDNLQLDVEKCAVQVSEKTKVLLPVHLHGRMSDMDAMLSLAEEKSLHVIEDAAQAHGAARGIHRAGTSGTLGCFSFYPTKNLGALGDGGAVVCSDLALKEKLLHLRNYGQSEKYVHDHPGINSRLDELQAAFLSVRLKYLEQETEIRRTLATKYKEQLEGTPLWFPKDPRDAFPVFHIFVVRTQKRDALQQYLKNNGIECQIHYPIPVHRQKLFAQIGRGHGNCFVAEKASTQLLSLPFFPGMSTDAIAFVCEKIHTFFNKPSPPAFG